MAVAACAADAQPVQRLTPGRRFRVALCAALIVFGGTLTHAPPATADDDPIQRATAQREALQERITQQQDEIERLADEQRLLRAKVAETTASLHEINLDLTAVRAEVADALRQLRSARARHAELVREVAALDGTVVFLQDQADELRADLEARRRALAAHLAEAYRVGQASLLEQMLSSESLLQGMVDQRSYLALGERDVQLARSIEDDTAILASQQRQVSHVRYRTERLRRDVEQQAADLAVQRQRLAASELRLAKLEAETARLLEEEKRHHARIVRSRAEAKKSLEDQQHREQQLTRRIRRLIEEERHRGRLPSEYNGTFRWPVKGTVTQEFGCTGFEWEPPLDDCEHFHKGIDLVGEEPGMPVRAAAGGVILLIGFNPYDPPEDPAWIVIIGHSDELQSWYGHLEPGSVASLKDGMKVKAGQIIGHMGNSGKSTGEHLHWGVESRAEFMDPRLFL